MDNPPDNHQEILNRCEYHLAYLGLDNFIELVKRQHPLIVVESTEDIKTIELRCLTFDEEETLNGIIFQGLGRAIDPEDNTGKPFVKDIIVKKEPNIEMINSSDETILNMGASEKQNNMEKTLFEDHDNHEDRSVPGTHPSKLPKSQSDNIRDKIGDTWDNTSVLGMDPNDMSVPGTDPGKLPKLHSDISDDTDDFECK